MDKSLIRKRFSRAAQTYCKEAVIQANIARHMTDIMLRTDFPRNGAQVLEFGCGCGGFTALWTPSFHPAFLWLNDLCPEVRPTALKNVAPGIPVHFLEGDIEQLPLPEAFDAVVSCSALQWLEHPETFLHRCAANLRPGGYLACSTFGPQNVYEVTQLTGVTLPYRSLDEWTTLLQTDYEIVHVSEELRQLTFPDPLSMLHHLKNTGVTGIRREKWTPNTLRKFCEQYRTLFSTDASAQPEVRLTYHPLYLMARKK